MIMDWKQTINIRTHDIVTLGLWGPEAKNALGNFVDPNEISIENFPFATAKYLTLIYLVEKLLMSGRHVFRMSVKVAGKFI